MRQEGVRLSREEKELGYKLLNYIEEKVDEGEESLRESLEKTKKDNPEDLKTILSQNIHHEKYRRESFPITHYCFKVIEDIIKSPTLEQILHQKEKADLLIEYGADTSALDYKGMDYKTYKEDVSDYKNLLFKFVENSIIDSTSSLDPELLKNTLEQISQKDPEFLQNLSQGAVEFQIGKHKTTLKYPYPHYCINCAVGQIIENAQYKYENNQENLYESASVLIENAQKLTNLIEKYANGSKEKVDYRNRSYNDYLEETKRKFLQPETSQERSSENTTQESKIIEDYVGSSPRSFQAGKVVSRDPQQTSL